MKKVFAALLLCLITCQAFAFDFNQSGLPLGSATGDLLWWNATSGKWLKGLTFPAVASQSGNCLTTDGSVLSWGACGGGGGSTALSGLTAATAGNVIANGNNAQEWRYSLTSTGAVGLLIDDAVTASTGSGSVLLSIESKAGTSGMPFRIKYGTNTIIDTTYGSFNISSIGSSTWSTSAAGSIALVGAISNAGMNIDGDSGHIGSQQGVSPSVTTGCGSGGDAAVSGTDNVFQVTMGSGTPSASCKITFNTAFASAPTCVASSAAAVVAIKVVSTTDFVTLSVLTTFTASGIVNVLCF